LGLHGQRGLYVLSRSRYLEYLCDNGSDNETGT